MARIAGVDLPRNKHVYIALTYIYGIGNPRSARILNQAKVDPMKKVQDLGISVKSLGRGDAKSEQAGSLQTQIRRFQIAQAA